MFASASLLLLVGVAAPAGEQLPPSVTVYTNVESAVWRRGLQSAFDNTWPEVTWRIEAATDAGLNTPVDKTAWLLRVESKKQDVPPTLQELEFVLKTPRGQARADAKAPDDLGGSWLFPVGTCGALACGPCPACAGPGLGVAYTVSALILGGPSATGEAIGGGLATMAAMCLLWPCMLIPPGCLIWPLEASKQLRPLAHHYRLRASAEEVLPDLVREAYLEPAPPPASGAAPPANTEAPAPEPEKDATEEKEPTLSF